MAAKITLTLTQEEHGTDEAMAQTIGLLTAIGVAPTKKVVLTVECEAEDVDSYADDMDIALSGRPTGIEVTIKTTVERHVERRKMASVTPMDKAWAN